MGKRRGVDSQNKNGNERENKIGGRRKRRKTKQKIKGNNIERQRRIK